MYVINDMEYLGHLARTGILKTLLLQCSIAVSVIKLNNYKCILRQQIQREPGVVELQVDDGFRPWTAGKRDACSIGDLSSIYVASKQPNSHLVLSPEDWCLEKVADHSTVSRVSFDDFVANNITDDRTIELYKLVNYNYAG